MTLQDIQAGGRAVPFSLIGSDGAVATQTQQRLGLHRVLDPPADGVFGPVSLWALTQFQRRAGITGPPTLDAALAAALLSDEPLFPLSTSSSQAGRIVRALQAAGYWIACHPDCVNIVYVEGMDADGTPNGDAPNEFNDLRMVLRVNRAGNPEIVEAWEATTEPGQYYTLHHLDPLGAARIAFGQYKSWSVGIHMAGRPTAHEALVQTAPIRVYRDLNEDFQRTGDAIFEGIFGVNQHWGFDLPRADVGRASAGCLVGRTKNGHREFMALCKADPRYAANNSYRFLTAVLPAADVPAASSGGG